MESPTLAKPRVSYPTLPSERYEAGKPWPAGFVSDSSQVDTKSAGEALSLMAETASSRAAGGRVLSVCLCHTYYSTVLNPRLFAFSVWDFSADGTPRDPFEDGGEVRYAVIVNMPAPLQLEVGLVFLMQLLERQVVLSDIRERGEPVTAFATRVPDADARARSEIIDRLHYGWDVAAQAVRRKAAEVGIELRVRYETDVIPDRAALVRRLPSLRRLYNRIEVAREMVDKIVSMVGGQNPRLEMSGGSAAMQTFLEERLAASNVRLYMNQTLRDAEVCGNGFFVSGEGPGEFQFRNLLPESVLVRPGRFEVQAPEGLEVVHGHVLHLRGIEQIESPYGVSLLEALLPNLVQSDVVANARAFAGRVLAESTNEMLRERARESLGFAEAMGEKIDETLGELLAFPRDHLPAPVSDLYFPGQERFSEGR